MGKLILCIACIALAAYFGVWVLFIGGIIDIVEYFKTNSTSTMVLAFGILKAIVAFPVGRLLLLLAVIFTR